MSIRTRDVIQVLQVAGIRVLAAGGALRDWLLGRRAKDVDLCVDHGLTKVHELLRQAFPECDPVVFHLERFGMLRWGASGHIDLNILRSAQDIENVNMWMTTFTARQNLVNDARTRDFSINAYYYDFAEHKRSANPHVLDPLGCGFQDLEKRRLHFVAHPKVLKSSFRMTFRIIQFWGRGFAPGDDVLGYLHRHADRDVLGMGEERLERWIGSRYREGKLDLDDFRERLLSHLTHSQAHDLVSMVCDRQGRS